MLLQLLVISDYLYQLIF